MEKIARLVNFPFSKTEEILVKTALLHNKVLAFPTETFYGWVEMHFLKKLQIVFITLRKDPEINRCLF